MTIWQLIKKKLKIKNKKIRTRKLNGCPQKKGICEKVGTISTRKPNSALRKVAKVWLPSNKLTTYAFIPGIGHKLQKFSNVLIRGGRVKDIPGMRYQIIRGKLDANPVWRRRKGISRYGAKNVSLVWDSRKRHQRRKKH